VVAGLSRWWWCNLLYVCRWVLWWPGWASMTWWVVITWGWCGGRTALEGRPGGDPGKDFG